MPTTETTQTAEEIGTNQAVVRERDLWARPCTIFDGWQTRSLPLTNFAGRVYPALHSEMMVQLLNIQPHERVLDIGGGDSPFSRANVVTDAFPDMNAHRSGRSACLKAADGSDMEFVQCFAEELPFEDKAFDVAYCRMVLEHAIDPAAACREMMRVARRGFLETPSPLAEYLGGHPTHRWIVWVEKSRRTPPDARVSPQAVSPRPARLRPARRMVPGHGVSLRLGMAVPQRGLYSAGVGGSSSRSAWKKTAI